MFSVINIINKLKLRTGQIRAESFKKREFKYRELSDSTEKQHRAKQILLAVISMLKDLELLKDIELREAEGSRELKPPWLVSLFLTL